MANPLLFQRGWQRPGQMVLSEKPTPKRVGSRSKEGRCAQLGCTLHFRGRQDQEFSAWSARLRFPKAARTASAVRDGLTPNFLVFRVQTCELEPLAEAEMRVGKVGAPLGATTHSFIGSMVWEGLPRGCAEMLEIVLSLSGSLSNCLLHVRLCCVSIDHGASDRRGSLCG